MKILHRRSLLHFLALSAPLLPLALAGCQKPNPLIGTWNGTLTIKIPQMPAATTLRLEMKFDKGSEGVTGSLKSIDQNGLNFVFDTVKVEGQKVNLTVNGLSASYDGKINASGDQMTGQWKQGPITLPLTMKKAK